MSHSHEVKKVKTSETALDDASFGSVTVNNVSGRPVSFGSPVVLLYPGDSAVCCACNPTLDKFVANKLVKVVDKADAKQESAPKPKKQKLEEVRPEETFETVAEVEPLPSVQLTSSSNGETFNSEEL